MENLHNRFENVILDCIVKPVSEETDSPDNTDDLIDALFIKRGSLVVVEASREVDSLALGASLVHRLAIQDHEVPYVPLRSEEEEVTSLIGLEIGVSRGDITASSEGRIEALAVPDRLHKLKVGLWSAGLVTTGMLWEVLEQACPEGEKLFVVLDSAEMLEPPHSDGLASTIRALQGFSGDGITVIAVASKVGRGRAAGLLRRHRRRQRSPWTRGNAASERPWCSQSRSIAVAAGRSCLIYRRSRQIEFRRRNTRRRPYVRQSF